MQSVAGVILAGGQGQRFGGADKALLEINGAPLIEHVIARFKPQIGPLALNANGDLSRFSAYCETIIPDSFGSFDGPLAGLLAGMEWARAINCRYLASVAVDTLFFPKYLVDALAVARNAANLPIALAAQKEDQDRLILHPTFGLWDTKLADELRAALEAGERRVRKWAYSHGVAEQCFEGYAYDPFFNINTSDDLKRAQHMAKDCL